MQLRYSERITDFRGADNRNNEYNVPVGRAYDSLNIEFQTGQVNLPRGGFQPYGTLNTDPQTLQVPLDIPYNIVSSCQWRTADLNILLMYGIDPSTGKGSLLATSSLNAFNAGLFPVFRADGTEVKDLNSTNARFAQYGGFVLVAFHDTDHNGQDKAIIVTRNPNGKLVADEAFPCPPNKSFTAVVSPQTPAVEQACTVGTHRIAYVPEYVSGYLGRLAPDNSTGSSIPTIQSFAPVSVIVSASQCVNVTFAPVWDANIVAVHMVYAPVSNPQQFYYLPNGRLVIDHSNPSQQLTYRIAISDDNLLANTLQATDNLFLWCSARNGTPPFKPHGVFVYGRRACWIADIPSSENAFNTGKRSVVVVSELDNPQQFYQDSSIVASSSGRKLVAGSAIAGGILVSGPDFLSKFNDIAEDPVGWSESIIDELRGAIGGGCMQAAAGAFSPDDKTGSVTTHWWLMTRYGLFYTAAGSLPSFPLSYLQGPNDGQNNDGVVGVLDRVNWNAANCISIAECPQYQAVLVAVPLDGATSPTHLLYYNYARGFYYNQVDYSLWEIGGGFKLGCIATVAYSRGTWRTGSTQNNVQSRVEWWAMPGEGSLARYIMRRGIAGELTNSALHTDNGFRIHSYFTLSALPKSPDEWHRLGPFTVEYTCAGTMVVGLYPTNQWNKLLKSFEMDGAESSTKTAYRSLLCIAQAMRFTLSMKGTGDYGTLMGFTYFHQNVGKIRKTAQRLVSGV